jgi:hypothetical protein
MKTNSLAAAAALSDLDLLARVNQLARSEREATAELVAHLAALELRPSLYAAEGYGSLFAYCTEVLRLSEDAACNRIDAARACRDFPIILDLLTSGSLTLTSVRMLRKHLTPENHEVVLARAANQRKERIEALVAELAPKPDVVSSVRKLPIPTSTAPRIHLRQPLHYLWRSFLRPTLTIRAAEIDRAHRRSFIRTRGRSSNRWRRNGTVSSSRSASPPTTSCGSSRLSCAARCRAGIPA